jgi:hypothetical protein
LAGILWCVIGSAACSVSQDLGVVALAAADAAVRRRRVTGTHHQNVSGVLAVSTSGQRRPGLKHLHHAAACCLADTAG